MGELELKNQANEAENNERGAALVEYALLVALIAVICIAALKVLGGTVSEQFSEITSALTGA